jgi:hypothetical protein
MKTTSPTQHIEVWGIGVNRELNDARRDGGVLRMGDERRAPSDGGQAETVIEAPNARRHVQ